MRKLLALLALLVGIAAPAQAQEEPAPLEDVVLQGRVLRPDGSPLANTLIRVDAVKGTSGFAIFSFFATAGFSTISCFDPASELCILPNTKTFTTTSDANGRYRFLFPKAKRRGEQTNTDYFLSAALQSRPDGSAAIAQYELELLTPVHDAPDLVVWDPAASIKPGERSYDLEYRRRADSHNELRSFIDEKPVRILRDGERTIEARDLEDATVRLVPYATKDERAGGTIYHQRFTATGAVLRGGLVPLSRNAACGVTLADGSNVAGCRYTDGDIATPGRSTDNPCPPLSDGRSDVPEGCEPPVHAVTVDLGAPKDVAEVRARGCGCSFEGSADGTKWDRLGPGTFRNKSLRFVRATGRFGDTAEVSVWGPWPDTAPTPLSPGAASGPAPTPLLPPAAGGDAVPRLLYAIAVAALAFAAYQLNKAQLTSR